MINLEKLNRKSVSIPFKKTYPCTILSPPFCNFSYSLPLHKAEEVIKIYSPPLKRGGGSLNYVSLHTSCLISVIIRKKSLVVSSGLELELDPPLSGWYIYIILYRQSFVSPCSIQTDLGQFRYYLGQPQCTYIIIKYFLQEGWNFTTTTP